MYKYLVSPYLIQVRYLTGRVGFSRTFARITYNNVDGIVNQRVDNINKIPFI